MVAEIFFLIAQDMAKPIKAGVSDTPGPGDPSADKRGDRLRRSTTGAPMGIHVHRDIMKRMNSKLPRTVHGKAKQASILARDQVALSANPHPHWACTSSPEPFTYVAPAEREKEACTPAWGGAEQTSTIHATRYRALKAC